MGQGDQDRGREERSGEARRPVEVSPLVGQEELDAELEKAARLAQFRRTQRWENYRQFLVLATFSVGTVVILVAMAMSSYCLLMSDNPESIALSKWVLETLLGALIAGLIAFWAVKSFEK